MTGDNREPKDPSEISELYEQIAQGAHEGIIVVDRDCRYRFWNPEMERTSGLSKEDVLGKTPWELFPFLKDAGIQTTLERAFAGETVTSPDFPYSVPGTGRSGWSVQRMGPLRDRSGNVKGAIIFVADITERKTHEETIARQLAEIRAYYDHAPVGLAVLTSDLRYIRINETLAKLNGVPAADHIGKTVEEIFPSLATQVREVTSAIVRTGRPVVDIECTQDAAGTPGVRRSTLESWYPILDAQGKVEAFTVIVQDFTDRLESEQEREKLRAQLVQAQKMEAIGSVAGGVAHDFNNLLTVILAQADVALRLLPANGRATDALCEIRDAGLRAGSLTRQLLAFSRRQVLQLVPVDVNGIVHNIENMLHGVLGAETELVTFLAPDLGITIADIGQTELVLVNLVVNARDAMPKGGTVTVRTANVDLDEGEATRMSLRAGRYVELSVTDTGIGMDEETRAHCFEPFFTTKDVGKGTGLGLSTASGIVRQSDGEIIVESRPGIGTTFRVYLPRAVGVEAARGNRPESVAPGRGERILLVEDERSVIAAIKVILDHAGYDVKTATRGDEALRIWENDPDAIDLVISDVVMPVMDGRTMVEKMRERRPDARIILMSGYADKMVKSLDLLPDVGFLGKPFDGADLLRKVREVLDTGPAGLER